MLEREAIYKPGASFIEIDGVTMFRFQSDASSVIGPRKATKADKEAFPMEWLAFNQGRLSHLDHDHNGVPGGAAPPVSDADVTAPPKRRGRPPKG